MAFNDLTTEDWAEFKALVDRLCGNGEPLTDTEFDRMQELGERAEEGEPICEAIADILCDEDFEIPDADDVATSTEQE